MDSTRRLAALIGLLLVVAVVVGLVATNDDDEPADAGVPADAAIAVGADDSPADRSPADDSADGAPSSSDRAEAPTTTASPTPAGEEGRDNPDLADRGAHLPLLNIDGWLQSDVTSLEELRGSVVAVQFWTFGCSNCKATLPHMRALYEKYDGGGGDFEIVGIHAPEFDYEADVDAIAAAAADLGVVWPIALDTEKRTFRSWQGDRRFWPRIYLIDRDGNVRYDRIGEGRYDEIDAAVGALIAEGGT